MLLQVFLDVLLCGLIIKMDDDVFRTRGVVLPSNEHEPSRGVREPHLHDEQSAHAVTADTSEGVVG